MKLFSDKRGIELSINFIVMLILAIAVFAGGLVFASKFFGHAEKVKGSLDAQTEKQIEKLLDSGSLVVIPISTKEINKNKHGTFGVGVLAQNTGNYVLKVEYTDEAYRPKTMDPIEADGASWLMEGSAQQEMHLQKNEKGKFLVGVSVPKNAVRGTYIYKATVDYMGNPDAEPPIAELTPYDPSLQFIVRVP